MSAPDQPPQRTMQSASPNPPTDMAASPQSAEKPNDPSIDRSTGEPAHASPELEEKIPIPFIKDGEITVSGIRLTRRIALCLATALAIAALVYFAWWRQEDSDKHTTEKSPVVSQSPGAQIAIDSPAAKLTQSKTSGPQSPAHVEGSVTYNINVMPPSDHARALADKVIAEWVREAIRSERDKLTSENTALREQLAEALSRIERDAKAHVEPAVEALRQADEDRALEPSQDYLADKAESLYADAKRDREAFLETARQLVAVAYFANDHAAMKLWSDRVLEFEPDNVFIRAILGDYALTHESLPSALAHFTVMLDATRRKCDASPDALDAQRDLSVSLNKIGDVRVAQGKLDEALKAYDDGLAIARRLAEGDPTNTEWQRDLSVSFKKIGDVYVAQGKGDEALKAYNDALAIARRLAEGDPTNTGWQRDLSVSFGQIGDVRVDQGKLDEALKAYDDGLVITRRLADGDPTNTEWQRDLSVSFTKIGDMYIAQGKLDEALKVYEDGLAISRRLADADPTNTEWQRDLAVSFNKIGDVYVAQGKLDEALKAYNDGLAIRRRLTEGDPTNTEWQRDLALSLQRTGWTNAHLGRRAKGLEDARAALAILERLAKHDPSNAVWRGDVEQTKRLVAEIEAMAP